MDKKSKLIPLGVISSAHGIRGFVVIRSFTDPIENIVKLPIVDKNYNVINIELISTHNNKLICSIAGCASRNHAETLCKTILYCERKALPSTDEDEFYISDLIGLSVLSPKREIIGSILNVVNYGAGDILELEIIIAKNPKGTEKGTDNINNTINTCMQNTNSKEKHLIAFRDEYFPQITDEYIICSDIAMKFIFHK